MTGAAVPLPACDGSPPSRAGASPSAKRAEARRGASAFQTQTKTVLVMTDLKIKKSGHKAVKGC
eukprot:CAMPEP_0180221704 /NCGR_PEP_ID=MMETSP0987-20121128/20108_1 /TAXON_ID=697907 /ORGANISM="non described non described, Strain CCMP2293" /LENGTH=63 /DNA_ID=CAMNT_0022183321 /DNA_START=303 /DNA_END=492 /DNA_ORIENTATION=+